MAKKRKPASEPGLFDLPPAPPAPAPPPAKAEYRAIKRLVTSSAAPARPASIKVAAPPPAAAKPAAPLASRQKYGKFKTVPDAPDIGYYFELGRNWEIPLGKWKLNGKLVHVTSVGHSSSEIGSMFHEELKDRKKWPAGEEVTIVRYRRLE